MTAKQQKTKAARPDAAVGNSQSERKVTNTQGQSTYFSEEVFADMLERIACGDSVRAICDEHGFPSRKTFYGWVLRNEDLRLRYETALVARHYALADETLEIADEPVGSLESGATDSGAVQKQRLQVDTRKWILSKLVPKKYGDKITQEVTGSDGGPVQQVVLTAEDYKAARVDMISKDDV